MTFAAAGKDQIRGGRQHAALGVVHHLEVPLLLAGLRIDRAERPISLILGAIGDWRAAGGTAARTRRRAARVLLSSLPRRNLGVPGDRGVVVPRRDVEKTGSRTERRGVPVRATLRPRFDTSAFRRR